MQLDISCDAVRQPVRLGRSSVNTIEILEGLKPGDQVVLPICRHGMHTTASD